MCDVTLSSVGPVQLQPPRLLLGVLQHSFPPQTLPGLEAELSHLSWRSVFAGFMSHCRKELKILVAPFGLLTTSAQFSVLFTELSKLGKVLLTWTRVWMGQHGNRQSVRSQGQSQRFLCRVVSLTRKDTCTL